MKIPHWVRSCFNVYDNQNHNGIIEQVEIDALKGSGSIFDPLKKCYCVSAGMDINKFIYANREMFPGVQYTDKEYVKGRKILKNGKLITTKKKRGKCKDDNKGIFVKQGEFAVKMYSKETPSLQTNNICNCVAVTVYDKETKKGFLTHIDNIYRANCLENILKNSNLNPKTSEVRIIGGMTDNSEGIIEIIDETIRKLNLNIVEYDILGKHGKAIRSILLDLKTGNLYNYDELKPEYYDEFEDKPKELIKNKKSE